MNLIRPMALGLVVTLLAACDQTPAPPEPTPAPEPAAPAVEQPKVPAQPVEVERTVEAKPEQPPAPPRQEPRVRAAPPDKAPEAARVLPKAAQKPAPKVEPPPADKLDLRLPMNWYSAWSWGLRWSSPSASRCCRRCSWRNRPSPVPISSTAD